MIFMKHKNKTLCKQILNNNYSAFRASLDISFKYPIHFITVMALE